MIDDPTHQSPTGAITSFLFLFLLAMLPMIPGPGAAGSADSEMTSDRRLISKVDSTELIRIVRDLSGANEIEVWGLPFRLSTRYALVEGKDIACQYLIDEIREIGYEPVIQRFPISIQWMWLNAVIISEAGDSVFVGDYSGKVRAASSLDDFQRYEVLGQLDGKIFDLEINSAVDPPGKLWAACGLPELGLGAVFRSEDGGRTWSEIFSRSDVLTLYTITMSGEWGFAAGANGSVIRAFGQGLYWSVLDPATFEHKDIFGSTSIDGEHFWLCGSEGLLYETEDFGVSWISHDLTTASLNANDFYDSRRGVIAGTETAFYTLDGGDTWIEADVDARFRCVRMADSLRVLAGGVDGVIWISEDGGASWNELAGVCQTDQYAQSVTGLGADRFWFVGGTDVRMLDIGPPDSCSIIAVSDTIIGKNISFLHDGMDSPDERIVLSAHYDSYSRNEPEVCAPGADDNATGVAAVLESARALYGERTDRTVEFILFDGEELGLKGSRYFAAYIDTNVSYEAVINLDMLGYDYGADRSLVIAGRRDSPEDSTLAVMIEETTAQLGIQLYPYFVPGASLTSDHMSFWEMGFPSIMLIEGDSGELTPYYHTCGDEADRVDYGLHLAATKAALAAVASLSGHTPAPVVATAVLRQNWPNPFSDHTRIPFYVPEATRVSLSVYDVAGREVARLLDDVRFEGDQEYEWDGRGGSGRALATGVYFLRMRTHQYEAVRKVVIIR